MNDWFNNASGTETFIATIAACVILSLVFGVIKGILKHINYAWFLDHKFKAGLATETFVRVEVNDARRSAETRLEEHKFDADLTEFYTFSYINQLRGKLGMIPIENDVPNPTDYAVNAFEQKRMQEEIDFVLAEIETNFTLDHEEEEMNTDALRAEAV